MPITQGVGTDAGSFGSTGGGTGGSGGSGGSGGPGETIMTPGSRATSGITTGTYGIFRGAPDRVERGPGVDVDPRATVTVMPSTIAGAANTQVVGVATGPGDMAKGGPRIALQPTSNPRTIKVRNLNEIGVYSTVQGEGVTVDVQE